MSGLDEKEQIEEMVKITGTDMAKMIWAQMLWSEKLLMRLAEDGIHERYMDLIAEATKIGAAMLYMEMERVTKVD